MLNKNELDKILRKYEIDNFYVNFKHPFSEKHTCYPDEMAIERVNAYVRDRNLNVASSKVIKFFAPDWDNDNNEIALANDLECHTVAGNYEISKKVFEEANARKPLILIWTKEDGFLLSEEDE